MADSGLVPSELNPCIPSDLTQFLLSMKRSDVTLLLPWSQALFWKGLADLAVDI